MGIVQNGRLIAQSGNTSLSHAAFVSRTVGQLPEGATVITFGKNAAGQIGANYSRTFHGNSLPVSQDVLDAVLAAFK